MLNVRRIAAAGLLFRRGGSEPGIVLEALALIALLGLSYHFMGERIATRLLPGGDEGSWMSPAAELLRGNGFSTRWLMFHYLEPYQLPRPDDFRFPGLVVLLSAAFAVFGTGYGTALWTVAATFLAAVVVTYLTVRRIFGVWTALSVAALMVFSLLNLGWNTYVLTEGLFGLVVAIVVWWSVSHDVLKWQWWVGTGALVGLLYLVRGNAVLFAPGLLVMFAFERRRARLPWRYMAAACGALLLVMSPWLTRNLLNFGNPMHVAGDAWFFRLDRSDPWNFTAWQFMERYGAFVIPLKLLKGFFALARSWHEFEHGLELVPLLLLPVYVVLRRRLYNPFVVTGLALSLPACAYESVPIWAGIRYWTPLLPFVYAPGIAAAHLLVVRFAGSRHPRLAFIVSGVLTLALLAPVYYPHRYYERTYAAAPMADRTLLRNHIGQLESLVPPAASYCAYDLAQVNFLTDRHCVGIHDHFDIEKWVPAALDKFAPVCLALTHQECSIDQVRRVVAQIRSSGWQLDTAGVNELAVYYRMYR